MTETTDDKGREYSVRPWGNYTVLDDEMFDHHVKRIIVTPGKRLSYQFHAKRAEHWFIVSGQATVILDGVEHELGRDRASTSRSGKRIAARTTARCRSSSSRSSTGPTSARTTSCVSRTTSDGRTSSVRIDELLAAAPPDHSNSFLRNRTRRAPRSRPRSRTSTTGAVVRLGDLPRGRESRQRTYDLVTQIERDGYVSAMAHVICVGHTRAEMRDLFEELRRRRRPKHHGARR